MYSISQYLWSCKYPLIRPAGAVSDVENTTHSFFTVCEAFYRLE